MYQKTRGKIPLIGAGGIASAEDAWQKLRAGASLLQLYSALVYHGPQLVVDILRGVIDRMDRDGIKSVREVTGSGNSEWLEGGPAQLQNNPGTTTS
jgi:dihydroorotate dehydrogenase